MSTPCCLITSCSTTKPTDLIKQILVVDELPQSTRIVEDIDAYPWHVETKYYSADVCLCSSDSRTIGNEQFADSVQAFLVIFDSTQLSSFEQVMMWLPYLKEISPAVQVLVCDRCADNDAVSRSTAIKWCLDNAFELVELNPIVETNDEDDEDDFKETVGVKRIVEALSCHSWPNMVMKEKPSFRSAYFEQMMNDAVQENKNQRVMCNVPTSDCTGGSDADHQADCTAGSETDHESDRQQACTATSETTPEDVNERTAVANSSQEIIDALLVNSAGDISSSLLDGEEESFENLFEKLHIMKDAMNSMTTEERKKHAEDVTIQFWKAIGGDMADIDGLSDSD